MKYLKPTKMSAVFMLVLFAFGLSEAAQASSNFTARCEEAVDCILDSGENKSCLVVPVPPTAISSTFIPPGSFELKALRKGAWFYNEGTYNALMLLVSDHLTLIDFPMPIPSFASQTPIIPAIQRLLNGTVPIRVDMIYSHAHFDHIGSSRNVYNFLRGLNPKTKIYVWGTLETLNLIQRSPSNRSVPPNIIVRKRGATLRISRSLKVRMDIVGGHTVQDMRIYIPPSYGERGIVMYIDGVFPGYAPPFNFAITEDLRGYIQAQKDILKLNFDVIVPGHIGLGNRNDVRENIEYAEDVISAAQVGVDSVTPERLQQAGVGLVADPNANEFGNALFPFISVSRPLEIETCFKIVLRKWGCRLGAVDLSARGHCFTAVSFLNVDF
ncbi:unnamed protein product [Agarophyton chilense]